MRRQKEVSENLDKLTFRPRVFLPEKVIINDIPYLLDLEAQRYNSTLDFQTTIAVDNLIKRMLLNYCFTPDQPVVITSPRLPGYPPRQSEQSDADAQPKEPLTPLYTRSKDMYKVALASTSPPSDEGFLGSTVHTADALNKNTIESYMDTPSTGNNPANESTAKREVNPESQRWDTSEALQNLMICSTKDASPDPLRSVVSSSPFHPHMPQKKML